MFLQLVMETIVLFALKLLWLLHTVTGDYKCLCIHDGNSIVFSQPSMSVVLGFLANGDCKPTYPVWTFANWTAIQFHNQVTRWRNTWSFSGL